MFSGAGWNLIKLLWGSAWDDLFARDANKALAARIEGMVDGELQTFSARDTEYFRSHFFGKDPKLTRLIAHLAPENEMCRFAVTFFLLLLSWKTALSQDVITRVKRSAAEADRHGHEYSQWYLLESDPAPDGYAVSEALLELEGPVARGSTAQCIEGERPSRASGSFACNRWVRHSRERSPFRRC